MESEKVKEIKKGAMWGDVLNKIGYYKKRFKHTKEINVLIRLINELESENEKLKQHKRELEGGQRDLLKVIKEFDKETQQLKDRIAELEKEKTCVWEEWTDGDHSIWCCSNCKEDFCFIEGDVYENNYGYCPHCGAKITALKEIQEELDET